VPTMERILSDGTSAQRRREFASRIDSVDAVTRACKLIEALGPAR
jgi:hypothetical protein